MFRLRLPAAALALLSTVVALPAMAQSTYAFDVMAQSARPLGMDRSGRYVASEMFNPRTGLDEPVLWDDMARFPIALPAGAAFIRWPAISSDGWFLGHVNDLSAVGGLSYLWRPAVGGGFEALNLGLLDGLVDAVPAGMDDQHRVFGRASNRASRPGDVINRPFVWTPTDGMADLTSFGFPADELPDAVSPGGLIATKRFNIPFADPASAVAIAAPPAGYDPSLTSVITGAVTDAGDRAGVLRSTELPSQAPRAMARYAAAAGAWSVVSADFPSSALWEIGSLDDEGRMTFTALNAGWLADADGTHALTDRLSSAYGGSAVTVAGDRADDGRILAVLAPASASTRPLMGKLVPVAACTAQCLRAKLSVDARLTNRGNLIVAKVRVADEAGTPVPGATVQALLFNADGEARSAVTNSRGVATLRLRGPGGQGAIGAIVTDVSLADAAFDRTQGVLLQFAVPQRR